MLVILASRIVKGMGQLVGSNRPECSIFQMRRPVLRIERRLEDAGREDDLAVGRS